jgi:N-acyl-D-amino-acid deacylase
MTRSGIVLGVLLLQASGPPSQPVADVLLRGGTVYDGSGAEPVTADVAITGDRVRFVGDAAAAGVSARLTLDVTGRIVAPGFIDMHSHAELEEDYGKDGLPFLYQGITTAVIGVDGGGSPEVRHLFSGFRKSGRSGRAFASEKTPARESSSATSTPRASTTTAGRRKARGWSKRLERAA